MDAGRLRGGGADRGHCRARCCGCQQSAAVGTVGGAFFARTARRRVGDARPAWHAGLDVQLVLAHRHCREWRILFCVVRADHLLGNTPFASFRSPLGRSFTLQARGAAVRILAAPVGRRAQQMFSGIAGSTLSQEYSPPSFRQPQASCRRRLAGHDPWPRRAHTLGSVADREIVS